MSMTASASSHGCISAIAMCIPCSSSKFSSQSSLTLAAPQRASTRTSFRVCRAMVQQAVQGAPAAYAKEMERLSAKESLLLAVYIMHCDWFELLLRPRFVDDFHPFILISKEMLFLFISVSYVKKTRWNFAVVLTWDSGKFYLTLNILTPETSFQFKDAGGFEALVAGKTTEWQKIDVNERITGLERLNPTPRPTTSPFLEGRWNFEWFGSGSPGLFAARIIFENFPSSLANLSKMDVVIKDGNAKITANLTLLNSIDSKIILSTKLSVEGPLRMKEEYVEGGFVSPTIIEERVPEQLKGALGQAANAFQQLPAPIRDPVANGLKVPLSFDVKTPFPFLVYEGGSFQRLFMISYLDEEILIIRNTAGIPEVLTRLDAAPSSLGDSSPEYES
ncbi:plastid-lipid-associated protein [Vigna angularis]|uniref:Plastid-lipid-associated protein n=1 Tax=Phaseolus angularis TaxID=3914 RepID=A0A8T0KU40_PHAAN|nr:plastid-lipid-associated protein [Vigna angularis]